MSAKSKTPTQTNIRIPKQASLIKFSHGGVRTGAGRPNTTGRPAHVLRPHFHPDCPVWVTLKLEKDIPSLKNKDIFKHLRAGFDLAKAKGLRVIHYNILSTRLHVLVESNGKEELESATKSLATSFAKRMNLKLKRKGPVFKGRFVMKALSNHQEVEDCLHQIFEQPSSGALSSQIRLNVLGLRKPQLLTELERSIQDEILCPPKTRLAKGFVRPRT